MSPKKNVFISVINFNGTQSTIHCINSLKKQKTENLKLHIVVIDNGSTEPFFLQDEGSSYASVTVIKNKENLGFAAGHNIGIRYSLENKADYVMILNNDTVSDHLLVASLVSTLEREKLYGIAAPKIYFAKGSEFHKDRYRKEDLGKVIWYAGGLMDWGNVVGRHKGVDEVDTGQFDSEEQTDFASGCCMMVKREVLEKVGMFDERYFLYYEDADLNERVKRAGYAVAYVPKAVLWHKNAESSGGSGSDLQDYFISRNRLLFGYTYAPLRTKAALLKESMQLLIRGRKWQKKGIEDYYRKIFGRGRLHNIS